MPSPDAQIGLWTLSPRSSAVLSPRSLFPPGQRFPIPKHVTSGSLSPRSFFPTGQRFPTPNHVTTAFPVTSGSGDVTSGSGHVTSGSGHIKTRSPHQNEAYLAMWAPFTTSRVFAL